MFLLSHASRHNRTSTRQHFRPARQSGGLIDKNGLGTLVIMGRPLSAAAAALTPVEQLEHNGFVCFKGVLDPVTVDTLLLRAYATLMREKQSARETVKSNGSLIHLSDNPEYADIIGSKTILTLLRGLGATDPRWTGGFLISKPPGGPPLFWHQDWWGWTEPESYEVRAYQLFVMIYLTDTSLDNGCLRVIPGTHLREHRLHHLDTAHSKALQGYETPDAMEYASHPDELPVPVQAGDIVIGDARLIHGAYANLSSEERPLLTLWYMPHWSGMSPGMRARGMENYLRRDGIRTSVERPLTPRAWPEPLRRRVEAVLPACKDDEPPVPWQRTPDIRRFRGT